MHGGSSRGVAVLLWAGMTAFNGRERLKTIWLWSVGGSGFELIVCEGYGITQHGFTFDS